MLQFFSRKRVYFLVVHYKSGSLMAMKISQNLES